eukprot:7784250-Pyramimonas_sp.AAC.1
MDGENGEGAPAAGAGLKQPQLIAALSTLLDNRLGPLREQGGASGATGAQQVVDHPAVRAYADRKGKEPLYGETSPFFPRKPEWRSQAGVLFVENCKNLPVSTTQALRVADHASASVKKHYGRAGEQSRIELDCLYTVNTFLFDVIREQEALVGGLEPSDISDRLRRLTICGCATSRRS